MEKQNECVVDIIKNNFIDKNKTKEILKQKHLLDKREYIIVSICDFIGKVAKVHTLGGLFFYFTNTKTIRIENEWSTQIYNDLSKKKILLIFLLMKLICHTLISVRI